jgi:hypothetical protein
MSKHAIERTVPTQEGALKDFGGTPDFKDLNHEERGEFAGLGSGANPKVDGTVYGSGGGDEALAAIGGSLSGGGKSSSLDKGDAGDDPLAVKKGSEYTFNADSPWA